MDPEEHPGADIPLSSGWKAVPRLRSERRLENNGHPRSARWNRQTGHRLSCRERLEMRLRTDGIWPFVKKFGGECYPLLWREDHGRVVVSNLVIGDLDQPEVSFDGVSWGSFAQVKESF